MVGQATGGDRRRRATQLFADPGDDAIDLAREAVDDPGADRINGRLADQRARLGKLDLRQLGGALESAASDISNPGEMIPPMYSPACETTS